LLHACQLLQAVVGDTIVDLDQCPSVLRTCGLAAKLGWAAGEEELPMTCRLLHVDISGPWYTISRTANFALVFSLATAT